jgi:N-acetyl-anhydromuramyl-L-alanine amidase AmpD
MTIDYKTHRLPAWKPKVGGGVGTGCWFNSVSAKDLVILHYTAGANVLGAVREFKSRADGVSTPYVVGTDGKVFELYPPDCYSYHLGMTAKRGEPNPNANHIHERRGIGIEIVNVGPLKINGEYLCYWPPLTKENPYGAYLTRYCHISEEDRYIRVRDKWRGFNFFAAFPPVQMTAVAELVGLLVEQFNIPFVIPPKAKQLVTDIPWFVEFKGIAAHHHARTDKYDVGPAFDWNIFE